MVMVDTSVWIDYFANRKSPETDLLEHLTSRSEIILGDLILVEVLQGLKAGPHLQLVEAILSPLKAQSLCGPEIAPIAAANYRKLRQSGITIRGTIDVVIATWCIENGAMLLHNDRDFGMMENVLGLTSWRG